MTRSLPICFASSACPQRVVYLVRARVRQILALQVHLRAAQLLGQPLGVVQRRGSPDVLARKLREPRLERLVRLRGGVGALKLEDGGHERLRHEPPAELSEPPSIVW